MPTAPSERVCHVRERYPKVEKRDLRLETSASGHIILYQRLFVTGLKQNTADDGVAYTCIIKNLRTIDDDNDTWVNHNIIPY